MQDEEEKRTQFHHEAQAQYRAHHGYNTRPVASAARARSRSPPRAARLGSAALGGSIVPAGLDLEGAEDDERYSDDERRRAAAILGVDPYASTQEVRKAFRLKAFRIHPDKQPESRKRWAHEEMARLNWAHDRLTKRPPKRTDDFLAIEL